MKDILDKEQANTELVDEQLKDHCPSCGGTNLTNHTAVYAEDVEYFAICIDCNTRIS